MTPDLSFYLSHVRVDLYCPLPDVLRALRAIWSGASVPMVETTSTAAVEIEADAPHRVYCNGDAVDSLDESDQLLPNIEAVLYHLLREWHSELTLLHAALLHLGDPQGCAV